MSFNFVSIWTFDDPAAYSAGQATVVQSQNKFANPKRLLTAVNTGAAVVSDSHIPSEDTYTSPGVPVTTLGGTPSVPLVGSVIGSSDTYASNGRILSVFGGGK